MTLSEFEQFCLRHQEGMFSIAQQVLSNVQSSEDAVLEAMTRMYKVYRQFSFRTDTDGRIYALLVAKSVAHGYNRRYQPFNPVPSGPPPLQFPKKLPIDMWEPTPERAATLLLDELDHEQKIALRLHVMGLTCESIGVVLNLSPVSVRALIHLARTTLQDRLKEEGYLLE